MYTLQQQCQIVCAGQRSQVTGHRVRRAHLFSDTLNGPLGLCLHSQEIFFFCYELNTSDDTQSINAGPACT